MRVLFALLACVAFVNAQMGGGYTPMDTQGLQSNPDFMNVLNNGISQMGSSWELVSINSAESQVVAGVNYRICATLKNGDATKKFTLVIFSQPWTNTIQLKSQTAGCGSDAEIEDNLMGGFTNAELGEGESLDSNPRLDQAVQACLTKNGDLMLGGGFRFNRMISAQQQVTAGLTYHLKFEAKDTNTGKAKTISCKAYFPAGSHQCEATILKN